MDQINGNDDLLVISETKLNESFPEEQFKIPSFTKPFRSDRNQIGGRIKAFVRKDVPSKLISNETFNVEGIFIELTFTRNSGY